MDFRFSFEGRTERFIALGRVILASFSLLAVWLDPTTPGHYTELAYSLLALYVVYALAVALVVWASHSPLIYLRLVTHVLDLLLFSLFLYFTEGPTSPFFVYFIFSILCGALRWQWYGTLWTAVIALTAFLGMGFYAGQILQDPAFELNRFIIRSVYLGVVAALLAYLGAYESERRTQLAKLAAWPRGPSLELETVIRQVLEQAANILKAQRAVLIWEECEEPWLHLVILSEARLQWSRKPPGSLDAMINASLQGKSFFSENIHSSTVLVMDNP
jgi:hypothetical protein